MPGLPTWCELALKKSLIIEQTGSPLAAKPQRYPVVGFSSSAIVNCWPTFSSISFPLLLSVSFSYILLSV
ncbi:MAG: hypothetical protein M3Y24_00860 [Acidobacteriota bacterium]|nr:hypothetical protein [Acidobacteriota bacterium]